MLDCVCDGRNNDANITQEIFKNNIGDVENWFDPGDLFVVDRGFRDSLEP